MQQRILHDDKGNESEEDEIDPDINCLIIFTLHRCFVEGKVISIISTKFDLIKSK